ncbi:MAG: hypothetical protein RMJ39_10590 [Deltaproteobacteria bacterium]|nr:hypothetical protein [Deltaproteobacteria bacterium]
MAYVYPHLHKRLLNGKTLLIGCPKLDQADYYTKKLSEIIKLSELKSITLALMEIPCCRGFLFILKSALKDAKTELPLKVITVSTQGEIVREEDTF